MDSDFRKPNQSGDTPSPSPTPSPTPSRSSWQNDVISALHGSTHSNHTGQPALATVTATRTNDDHVAVKMEAAPVEDAGNMYVQPRQVEEASVSHTSQDYAAAPPQQTYISPDIPNNFSQDPFPPSDEDAEVMPIAVVQVVSTRGVEYAMLTLVLWLGSISLLGVILSLINGGRSAEVLAFPASVLVVCLPIFSFFFLRLKKAELLHPELKVDPSKRRLTQFTQLIAFATCLFTVIAFVYLLISTISGTAGTSVLKAVLNVIAVLAVAGGILAYYWFDEHKTKSRR